MEAAKSETVWTSPVANSDYVPWEESDTWENVAFKFVGIGTSFASPNGMRYHTAEGEPTGYQLLRVRWIKNSGRAEFGHVVRNGAGEIVAHIRQGYAWSWELQIDCASETYLKHVMPDGFVRENLLANTLNTVFYYLVEEGR